jgi:hypothetical protein
MAKVTLRYSTEVFRLPPDLERRIKELALPPDVVRQFREKLAVSLDLPQLRLELPAEWNIPDELVQAVEVAAAEAKAAEAAPAAKVKTKAKTKKTQPQAERVRWALRRLFPDGKLPVPAELGTKAMRQKIADELKHEPKTKDTPPRELPSWEVVDRVRKEPLS